MKKRSILMGLIKRLPEKCLDEVIAAVQQAAGLGVRNCDCPHCRSSSVIRYGRRCGKQRFQCKSCGRTFVETTNTIMYMSHQPLPVWEEVIEDTIKGLSLDETAERLGLTHQCAFDMRHKILLALQEEQPGPLSEVAELDETFVLDNYKGKKLSAELTRKARKHGAKAQKNGISSEYVCICTGIQRNGPALAVSVNRAKPSAEELREVYAGKLRPGTLTLFDGLRSYSAWGKNADVVLKDVSRVDESERAFYNLNTANSFHSFIKDRYRDYRGVATKYLNRYNALFALVYRAGSAALDDLRSRLLNPAPAKRHFTLHDVSSAGLLAI